MATPEQALQAAHAIAGGFQEYGPYIYGLALALVALAAVSALLISSKNSQIHDLKDQLLSATKVVNEVQEKRIADRDTFQGKLDALARETNETLAEVAKSNFTLTRAVEEIRPPKRRSSAQADDKPEVVG